MRAGGQLVEQDAEREEIRAEVHGVAADLFRRHVGGRAEQRALGGDVRSRLGHIAHPGQAEVENLHVAGRRADDVLRLQIPMHDAAVVRRFERARERERRVNHA